jgi:hypothetical protein
VVRCGYKNGHQKDRHHVFKRDLIWLRLQKLLTILSSIVDLIEGTCMIGSMRKMSLYVDNE